MKGEGQQVPSGLELVKIKRGDPFEFRRISPVACGVGVG
jgi:hypothetical protein